LMKIKFHNSFHRLGRSILAFTWMLILVLGLSQTTFAQSPYTSLVSGNWNDDNTWSGAGIPVAGDVVTIQGGHTVTLTADAACTSVTINGSLNIGNFIFSLSDNLAGTGAITMLSGTFNLGDDIFGYTGFFACGTGTVNFNRNGNQQVPAWTYYNLTTSTAGTKTLIGNIIINNNLNIDVNAVLDVNDPSDFNITIQGNWVHAGTFNKWHGTVSFTGGNNQTITGNPDETFYNLTVNKSGGNVQPITGSLQTITNNLLISNGTLDLGTNITTFNVGGTATVNGTLTCNSVTTKTITVNGNLSGTGVLNMSGGNLAHQLNLAGVTNSINTLTSGTASTVDYVRGGNQTMINSNNYRNLNISGTGSKSFSSNVSVAGILNMSSGSINCGANTLIVSNSATGAIVRTSGTIIGKLQRAIGTAGSEYLYPVGTAGSYNPAKITFNSLTAGNLIMYYTSGDIGNSGLVPPLNDNGVGVYDRFTTGYWSMTANVPLASSDYDVKLNYTGFAGINASSRILRRDNGGNLILGGTHGTIANPEITRTGLSGISGGITDLAICMGQPLITTQPADVQICPGANTTFNVVASGQASLSYQWQVDAGSGFGNIINGGVYSGATSNTLTITGAGLSMNGYHYRCVVTDGAGNSLNSNSALLTTTESIAPTWTTVAGNLNRTVECSDAAAIAAAQALVPAATDNCDVTLTPVKISGAFVVGGCPQEGTYTNTWTVTDD
jgi:hypothetical protein